MFNDAHAETEARFDMNGPGPEGPSVEVAPARELLWAALNHLIEQVEPVPPACYWDISEIPADGKPHTSALQDVLDWEHQEIARAMETLCDPERETDEGGEFYVIRRRDLARITGQMERGMDGYASRMSREGRDYFCGLLRELRSLADANRLQSA